ncbi:hypothetical protein KT99_01761 [Shewanella benthica KT99]|uniref:Uncharacterized protein n=1 Tax=Shewanella benthica KT99 TaxID=314608 RepID=A9D4V8_9GAMM|nr:hypothetical protein KT99_01761 [Shewanella benthica KT99]
MLIIIAHSAWVSGSLHVFAEETDIWLWLAGELTLGGIFMLTICWGIKKFWKGDLV